MSNKVEISEGTNFVSSDGGIPREQIARDFNAKGVAVDGAFAAGGQVYYAKGACPATPSQDAFQKLADSLNENVRAEVEATRPLSPLQFREATAAEVAIQCSAGAKSAEIKR